MRATRRCECGSCNKCKQRARYREDAGYREHMRQKAREYRQANLDLVRAKDRERGFRLYDPAKHKARKALNHEVCMGRIKREPCEKCGAEKTQAHHDDYSKPLVVRWLCSACHGIEHRKVAA